MPQAGIVVNVGCKVGEVLNVLAALAGRDVAERLLDSHRPVDLVAQGNKSRPVSLVFSALLLRGL